MTVPPNLHRQPSAVRMKGRYSNYFQSFDVVLFTHFYPISQGFVRATYSRIMKHNNYLCKVVSPMGIHVLRKPDCAPYCEDCTGDAICGLCHKNSPIIQLKRRRIITTQLCALTDRYIIRCSCPYQPTFGVFLVGMFRAELGFFECVAEVSDSPRFFEIL
jgi:hypothetical protein